jgi:uncharacterized protein YaeQ
MRWKPHVRFGGRAEETDRLKGQHRASVRSDHTAVAMWIHIGANDLQVAKWAGHRHASFTKSRYGHLFNTDPELAMARLDALIQEARDRVSGEVIQLRR